MTAIVSASLARLAFKHRYNGQLASPRTRCAAAGCDHLPRSLRLPYVFHLNMISATLGFYATARVQRSTLLSQYQRVGLTRPSRQHRQLLSLEFQSLHITVDHPHNGLSYRHPVRLQGEFVRTPDLLDRPGWLELDLLACSFCVPRTCRPSI